MSLSKKSKNVFNIQRIAVLLIAITGMAIMGYLYSLNISGGVSFCDLGEGVSCSEVNQSEYAKIAGVPMSALGFLYFLGIAFFALFKWDAKSKRLAVFATLVFLGPSLYLSAVELFLIKSICLFCELSKALMLGIIVLLLAMAPRVKFSPRQFAGAVVLALILGGATYFIQNRTPEAHYDSFAQCLYENGIRMYGSATCAFCARQRKLFGDSFEYIKEIECDPRNPGNVAELCIEKEIERTPTWILEDEEGGDVFRFEPGIVSLEKLADVSGCELVEDVENESIKP